MFPRRFFAGHFFAPRYFPQSIAAAAAEILAASNRAFALFRDKRAFVERRDKRAAVDRRDKVALVKGDE